MKQIEINKILTEADVWKAQRVLADNGIEKSETAVVLEALGYVLLDEELEDLLKWEWNKERYIIGKDFNTKDFFVYDNETDRYVCWCDTEEEAEEYVAREIN